MSKVDEAVRSLRETADILDGLPGSFRRYSILGSPFVNPETLRAEADWLEARLKDIEKVLDYHTPITTEMNSIFKKEA